MKRLAVERLANHVGELVETAPNEKVLLTRHDKPFALMSDALQYDAEDFEYITDPAFWKMIRERRSEDGDAIPLEQIEARLEEEEQAQRRHKTDQKG